jgi:fructokinase
MRHLSAWRLYKFICITLGPEGCCGFAENTIHVVPGFPVVACDTVGLGDAVAAAFLYGYHRGWPIAKISRFAKALGALVASSMGATPAWSIGGCFAIMNLRRNHVLEDA